MIRLFICGAVQVAFVTAFGTWAALRPEDASAWLLPFVAVVWVLLVYNNWPAVRALWARRDDGP